MRHLLRNATNLEIRKLTKGELHKHQSDLIITLIIQILFNILPGSLSEGNQIRESNKGHPNVTVCTWQALIHRKPKDSIKHSKAAGYENQKDCCTPRPTRQESNPMSNRHNISFGVHVLCYSFTVRLWSQLSCYSEINIHQSHRIQRKRNCTQWNKTFLPMNQSS